MRSSLVWGIGFAGLVVLTARCGGATDTLGNASPDASVDAKKEGGGSSTSGSGGSSSGSGGGSGSSSNGSGSTSGSSSGSSSGGSSGGSSGSTSGSSSGSSSGGLSDGSVCVCSNGQTCCGAGCVDTYDDPHNCGGCGNHCTDPKPTCISGKCEASPCSTQGQGNCSNTTTCCGNECCTDGQLCCVVEGPVVQEPKCVTPTAQQPTCPVGCPVCP